jgi:hypothetical protein
MECVEKKYALQLFEKGKQLAAKQGVNFSRYKMNLEK